jgi:hypothetical protein
MSVFNTVKNISETTTPDEVTSGKFMDDEDRSYDVFIDSRLVSEARVSQHTGDIYVQLDRDSPDAPRSIHICNENRTWVPWQPKNVIDVNLADKTVYPVPCATHGIRYVGTAEDATLATTESSLDVASLAELLATDCGYYAAANKHQKGTKRPVTAVLSSPPRQKRVRVSAKPRGVVATVTSREKERGDETKGAGNAGQRKLKADKGTGQRKGNTEEGKEVMGADAGNGKGKGNAYKGKGKGKVSDDAEKNLGKGKAKEIWGSTGGEEHEIPWESEPIPVPAMSGVSEPTVAGPSKEGNTDVVIDENEEDEMTTRKCEASHL